MGSALMLLLLLLMVMMTIYCYEYDYYNSLLSSFFLALSSINGNQ